ncbi:MAG: divalent-cation tolerance protein CutA [Candidatus Omnitrophica bacterium]|nr:divalent-cation tolerance protein CutA [Candidatus Omnitrophota bacterium]
MMNNMGQVKHIVVLVTVSSRQEAESIARGVVEAGLAACVNMVPQVSSLFRWQGKVEGAEESLLVIKTALVAMDKLIERITALHSYDVPEIIALPIVAGAQPYLNWIDESIGQPE